MKNIFYAIILFLGISSSLGCFNYETQFEGPYSVDDPILDPEIPRELVYVSGGSVYLANQFVQDSVIIDNSGEVQIASINPSHTDILFKRSGENIQIYNIEEERVTGEIAGSVNAIWFDYHSNNETIYYLIGDDLHTQGPPLLSENPKDLRDFFAINIDIIGAVITGGGDIIYTLKVTGGNTTYIIRTDASNETQNKYEREIPNAVRYMRINDDDGSLLGSSAPGNDLVEILPSFGGYDWFTSAQFGVPTSDGAYTVSNNSRVIETPNGTTVDITTGNVTSIDF